MLSAQGTPPEHVKPLVEEVDPSSRLADAQGTRLAYAVVAAGRGGAFVAPVP